MITRRYVVTGRVQGVGFRWFVLQQARRLGLGGYARNCADGTVEVVASGEQPSLEQLERALAAGPGAAHVTGVSRSDVADGERFTDFDVRRG